MSWKSLVSAGLLCVLASPAFALPQLEITSGGLDAAGNFVWNVRIAPTAAGTPMDAELAFSESGARSIVSVTNTGSAIWDTNNPGVAPASFAWVVNTGSPLKPEGLQGNFTGAAAGTTVVNAAALGGNATSAVNAALDQIYAALGSKDLTAPDLTSPAGTTIAASTPLLQIIVAGPDANSSTTSTLNLLGGYDGNTSGHVSEITSGTNSSNYKGFSGTASRFIVPGDADLSGFVTGADLVVLATNLGKPGSFIWTQGDFDRSGTVTGADLVVLASSLGKTDVPHTGVTTNLTKTGVLDSPGAGLGSGGAVPEPASIALIGLALLGSAGLVGRKR